MTDKECFEALQDKYEAIAKEAVKAPNLPVDVAINEAMDLFYNATQDRVKLATTGLELTLIEELPTRAGGMKYAQLLWDQVFTDRSEAEEEWKALQPEAYDLRDELLHYGRYAYRNDAKIMAQLARIADGQGHADLVMDLGNLAMLGKNHPEPLQAVNLDMTKLDRAAELSDQCNELLGRVHGARTSDDPTAKDMRDRAFTCLKDAVDAIREAGRFLFWKNEERAQLYGSRYFRELRSNQKKRAEQEA